MGMAKACLYERNEGCPVCYLVHQVLDNFIKIKLRPGVAWICVGHLSKGKDRPGNSEENLNNISLATPFLTCRSELEPPDRQV